MIAFQRIAVACFVLLALSQLADGLRCYQCTGCDSPFNSNGVVIVSQNDSQVYSCSKITARNVATKRDIVSPCTETNALGFGQWCCKTDLCNGATQTVSSGYLALAIVLAGVTMFF